MSLLIGLLGIAVLFGVAVTVHEFGHFAFAKLFGVRVERFSIGMGKVLISRQWGETEYAISALPVGGYVKLAGPVSRELEDEAEVLDAKDRVKELEAIQKERLNKSGRFSKGFLLQMLGAGALGVFGAWNANPYAAVTMAAAGMMIAGWSLAGRLRHHREIDSYEPAKLERDLADARARAQELDARMRASGETQEAEEALPGVSELGAEEERLASALIEDNIALRNKSFIAKFLIFVAGCAMNVLLAYLVLVVMMVVGVEEDVPATLRIEAPRSYSSLAQHDLRQGDLVVAINGEKPENWDELELLLLAAGARERAVELTLDRNGERVAVTIPWTPLGELSAPAPEGMTEEEISLWARGPAYKHLHRDMAFDPPIVIGAVAPNSAAEKGGLRLRDHVLEIDGEKIESWNRFIQIVEGSLGKTLRLKVERDGEILNLQVVPEEKNANGKGLLGIYRGYVTLKRDSLPFSQAIYAAGIEVYLRCRNYVQGLWRLVTGQVFRPLKQLGGALTIGHVAHKAANEGLQNFLNLFITLNLILAIMNLLPIPLLDGGHILFAAIEAVIRRPISARVLLGIYNASFYMIVVLAVFLLGNDVYQNSWRYFSWVENLFFKLT
jgi:regulator of sigma E protease